MKWIIDCYGYYVGVRLDETNRGHDLWNLWKLCRQVITELGSGGQDDEALGVVQQIVKDFHDLDKNAMAFRYATSKTGAMIELPDTSIDLANVRDVMEAADDFFTGADGLLVFSELQLTVRKGRRPDRRVSNLEVRSWQIADACAEHIQPRVPSLPSGAQAVGSFSNRSNSPSAAVT
jgi:hypothetical protein